MTDDLYTSYIQERDSYFEATQCLADECRKRDQEIAALKAEREEAREIIRGMSDLIWYGGDIAPLHRRPRQRDR